MHRADSDLIKACQRGEQAAWDLLIERYGRLVYSIPRRYGLHEADADDVFAAVWAIVFKSLDALRDNAKLSAWLITTTHRECWRAGRKRGVYKQLDQVMPDDSEPNQGDAEKWERQHLVRQALRALGGRCEELLTALFLQSGEPSYEAIAQRLGMPVGSIGPTRARCFQKLRTILREMDLAPDAEESSE